jgi:hypothetical protein
MFLRVSVLEPEGSDPLYVETDLIDEAMRMARRNGFRFRPDEDDFMMSKDNTRRMFNALKELDYSDFDVLLDFLRRDGKEGFEVSGVPWVQVPKGVTVHKVFQEDDH